MTMITADKGQIKNDDIRCRLANVANHSWEL